MANEGEGVISSPEMQASADASPAQTQSGTDEPLYNKREVVELRKEVRGIDGKLAGLSGAVAELVKALSPKETPAPAKKEPIANTGDAAIARVAELERTIALKDAFSELGIKPGAGQDLIAKAVRQDNPENVREYVAKYASAFAPAVTPEAPKPDPAPKETITRQVVANTGAPGVDPRHAIPVDLFQIDPGVWKGLSPEEKKARYQAYRRDRGGSFNPFADRQMANKPPEPPKR